MTVARSPLGSRNTGVRASLSISGIVRTSRVMDASSLPSANSCWHVGMTVTPSTSPTQACFIWMSASMACTMRRPES
jgi:hypothetical protein